MSYLRDQLAAAKVSRIKRRIAEAWAARKPCECAVCMAARGESGGATPMLDALRRALAGSIAIPDESPAPDAPKH